MCIREFHPYVKYNIVLSCSSFFFFPADIISCVEFNHDGDLLATGDKGGRVVIFQRDPIVSILTLHSIPLKLVSSKKENNNLSHPLIKAAYRNLVVMRW